MVSVRTVQFVNDYVYHIFNRGVERRPIFTAQREYQRFITLLDYYRHEKTPLSFSQCLKLPFELRRIYFEQLQKSPCAIEILAYCLMPNHFHLVVRQSRARGVVSAISNISNSYAKYFNVKHERVGPLFQGPFKAVFVETDEQLLHLSRYIHINPVISAIVSVKKLKAYPWSSLLVYLGSSKTSFIKTDLVQSQFRSVGDYKTFIYDQIGYARELAKIRHLMLGEEV